MKENFYIKQINKKSKGGFTLVESLVSLFIFAVSITALIVITGKGVNDTTIAKNRITGVALAQEGIEIVRSVRDSYSLSEATPGAGWDLFKTEVKDVCQNGCIFDILDDLPTATACFGVPTGSFPSTCPFLKREIISSDTNQILGTPGFYGYDSPSASTQDSPFQRTIYVDCVDAGCFEVKVESVVAWKQGSGINSVNSVEYLFNWFKITPITP